VISPTSKKLFSFRRRIKEWYLTRKTNYPWRKTKNKWHALVAEIMLQRTNADQVKPVYQKFVKNYRTPEDFLKKCSKNTNIFKNLGLIWRNELLFESAKAISKYGIPNNKEKLLQIPGIGNYIASAFLSLHLNKRAVLIDSNIVRLYARYFGFSYDGETRRKKWFYELADSITPKRNIKEFNYSILDFSRNICTYRPHCNECSLRRKCSYFEKSQKQE